MARMTAVAMLLPGLLAGIVIGTAISVNSITPLARDAWHATSTQDVSHYHGKFDRSGKSNATVTCATHLLMAYSAVATLMALLWGMGVIHTRVRAWVHRQGLAVTAGLMKLTSASKCLVPRGSVPLQHSPISGMQKVGEVVVSVIGNIAGVHKLKEVIRMRMRALGVQLEETRREFRGQVEERERELGAVKEKLEETEGRQVVEIREMREKVEERERELAEVKGELAEHKEAMREQWDVAERRRESILRELREEARKGEEEMRAELAREREERRWEVQEVERRRAADLMEMSGQMEERERELAAVKGELAEQKDVLVKLYVDLQFRESEGDQKTAWQVCTD
ncbi:unnamed protein product [Closterium sp. NIES-65]|nr:unnamed protein product [Closterium sp. NIES-65]